MCKQLTLIFSLVLALTAGYGQSPSGPRSAKPAKVQYGTASFYADKFEGRQTATGEIFTQQKMTAAHNTLPLGTWIRVTNLTNKKTVIVRVNDRLHPKNPRLVDLSKTAARKLGYTGQGLTRVRVEVLGRKEPQQDLASN
jgi:rare lipoprotein A